MRDDGKILLVVPVGFAILYLSNVDADFARHIDELSFVVGRTVVWLGGAAIVLLAGGILIMWFWTGIIWGLPELWRHFVRRD